MRCARWQRVPCAMRLFPILTITPHAVLKLRNLWGLYS